VFKFPDELRYSEDHSWMRRESGKRALLGLTEVVVSLIGNPEDVEFILAEGERFEIGDSLARVATTEEELELLSPCDGRILGFNVELADTPELVGEDPYDQGWLVRIELDDPDASLDLLSADQYEELVEDRLSKLDEEDDLEDELDLDDEEEY